MTFNRLLIAAFLLVAPIVVAAQQPAAPPPAPYQPGLDPAAMRAPLADSWPTYSGDYTSRRYSALTQVDQTTVRNLTLAWTARVAAPTAAAAAGRGGGPGGGAVPVILGGEGSGDLGGGNVTVKGAILNVNDILYVTAPDNVWAMDARDGRLLWQYFWRTKGGTHIGNRGAAIWNNYCSSRSLTLPGLARSPTGRALGRRDRDFDTVFSRWATYRTSAAPGDLTRILI